MLSNNMGHCFMGRGAMIPRKLKPFLCRMLSGYKPKNDVKDSYKILELEEGCSLDDVRNSYHNLAKKYHPDSSSGMADSRAFIRVEEAYRVVLSDLAAKQKCEPGEEEEDQFKSKSLQHRHYLSFEGVGIGTPSQREKQYMQFRVDRATEQVLEYRQQRLESRYAGSDLSMAKDVRQSKKVKITQAVERLVEDLIQESMAKGDFDNLSGKGKPLQKFSHSPHIDPMTHNLNRILIDNGYQPEWILLQKEIRETIERLRKSIVASRRKLGEPMTPPEQKQWGRICEQFAEDIRKLNKRVDNFNLVVPILSRQMVHFSTDKEILRARKNYEAVVEKVSDPGRKENGGEEGKRFGWKSSLLKWLKLTPK
ncbi:dnaJ homolog subfamily C member 28 [Onychostruthus taczanowskii]|uniref:dnaJ homolog subfamily C member 28 n=1 Tax=Onychostruthus taczanowskii TaxID=356909 RepID=UPI001B80230E|nr:dnaJ homolog subfamily C member 28 [Onychostruthus taczanowskii]XP_041258089.1 dnaJ homolog subfamily C member 28 [Onychostruthus taczanowskii]XP_041258090.1 dnaJ homolog subfamily C member 28 [Onychostruthus taczanowskii]XP_041258091.1 dnaJ homolog subfamily C member 28 [Onychostruthus taczanowskii]XP_041258092.1 dnaJ homolog subfamily C member 28 [Onychostruthus taczanowskii]XP_041258094.1 dnaJ homolog subfamily C member 28 [Onychostruthus taczanowskii]XP_041258095.1 dnaJ homolog subfami